ncbi:MAG: FAD-dependent oxidoreductase [Acidilobaceae archaeon]
MRFLFCKERAQPSGFEIAIVGGGPAGLTAAGALVCMGYDVIVLEAMPEAGGMVVFGIPDNRVNKKALRLGVKELMEAGVSFFFNTKVGRDVMLEDIVERYDAVILAIGAWRSKRLNVPGEDYNWVLGAVDWLSQVHLVRLGYEPRNKLTRVSGRVLVVGAGFTALDVITVLLEYPEFRDNVETIFLSYRRSRKDAPSGAKSIDELERRGVKVLEYTVPIGFREESGRRVVELTKTRVNESRLVELVDEKMKLEIDYVLLAVGQEPTPISTSLFLKRRADGTFWVDENMMTSADRVFACGDAVQGPSKIGPAVKSGLEVARRADLYLRRSSSA